MPTCKLQKLTRLRTGSHSLAVETGRHARPIKPREERICDCKEIEDETHFLLKCHKYYHLRQKYIGHLPEIRISELLQMEFAADYVNELDNMRNLYKR